MIGNKVIYTHKRCWQPPGEPLRTIDLFELIPDICGEYCIISVKYEPLTDDQKESLHSYLFNFRTQEIIEIEIYSTTMNNTTYWEEKGPITENSSHPVDPNYQQFHAHLLRIIQSGITSECL
jgi:hypothetical protein